MPLITYRQKKGLMEKGQFLVVRGVRKFYSPNTFYLVKVVKTKPLEVTSHYLNHLEWCEKRSDFRVDWEKSWAYKTNSKEFLAKSKNTVEILTGLSELGADGNGLISLTTCFPFWL